MPDLIPAQPPALPVEVPIDPQEASLEWLCEEVGVRLLKIDSRLASANVQHYGQEVDAALDIFLVKAELGNERLDGPGGFDVTVTVTYGTGTKTEAQMDLIASATVDALYKNPPNPDLDLADLPLEFLHIDPKTDTKREDLKKVRKRTVVLPLIAKRLS